jgi:tripartite-type tricarboxylate transporter receptor subunit TctC
MGRLPRAYAITANARLAAAPDIPTVEEDWRVYIDVVRLVGGSTPK